jgi:DNA-binding SARP family transcriptional activator
VSLRVRLLGSVDVHLNSVVTPIRAAKRIALLVVLALNVNQAMTVSDLTEAIWGDGPPASARANLRNYASALRHAAGDRIASASGTYKLTLHDGELDVQEFRTLTAEGREALGSRQPGRAADLLARSLDLWRGPAASGLPAGTRLDPDLANLEELRVSAVEDLAQAHLDLGRHTQVVPELRRHIRQHPLRERPWAQLMIALYRSGNTAGALAAFTTARATIQEQLGIEPDPRICSLHRAILRRSPALLASDWDTAGAAQRPA